jgi:hypothetical protein
VSASALKPVGPTVLALPGPSGIPGPIRPGHVATGSSSGYRPRYVPGQLLVKFRPDASKRAEQSALANAGASSRTDVDQLGVQVAGVPKAATADALATLQSSSVVDYVERDVAVSAFATPNDPLWPNQWGPVLAHVPTAWDVSQGSEKIVIAVLDTGVDSEQADLTGATTSGFDFVNNDSDPSDDQGHGSAAAGVLAARFNNGKGDAGICGRCVVLPVKVLDADGTGTTAGIAAGIVWATDNGARVISMSLGSPTSTQTLEDAVVYAEGHGVILVAAAGNGGSSAPSYPAASPGVISVAALAPSGGLYSWSNFGHWVQVAAAGCSPAIWPDKGNVNFCGTSAAAPLVAGIIGLALSAKPDATPTEIEHALTSTAAPLPDQVRYGLVDAAAVLSNLGVKTSALSALRADGFAPAFQGRVASSQLVRYARSLPVGQLTAMLAFTGASSLTLEVDDAGGPVARVTGKSPLPLRVSTVAAGGRYRFIVSGKAGASFALGLASERP